MERGYEFDALENRQIQGLQRTMRILSHALVFCGCTLLVSGSAFAVLLLGSEVSLLLPSSSAVSGLLLGLLGLLLQRSARGFEAIVRTEGADIAHLMEALGHLGNAFRLSAGLAAGLAVVWLGLLWTSLR